MNNGILLEENRKKWKKLNRGVVGRKCLHCDTFIHHGNFGGSNRWHYKRVGQGYTRVLCPTCSSKLGLPMPIWCDIFRGD